METKFKKIYNGNTSEKTYKRRPIKIQKSLLWRLLQIEYPSIRFNGEGFKKALCGGDVPEVYSSEFISKATSAMKIFKRSSMEDCTKDVCKKDLQRGRLLKGPSVFYRKSS